jgi:HlyD family secretion protein
MKKKIPLILILLLAGGFVVWKVRSSGRHENPNELSLSGNVDIREVVLGFRVAGRVSEMRAEEGDSVNKGQVIATLDPEPFQRELAEARAAAAAADAKLKMLQAGYRREEIAQATAALRERQVVLENARKVNERQQELAKTQAISSQERDDAEARYREAEARVKSAQEQLSLLQAGFRQEEIAAAKADAERAQASVARAQLRLEDAVLGAPEDGVILTRAQESGAIVQAGTPVVTLSLKSPVWVRTYIREPSLGKVRPGMPVEILTDSRPDKPYEGQIGYISPRAEFTPRNVETEELRTSLVYRMRVVANDPAGELRQGMPVTVHVRLQTTNAPASATR